MCGWRSSPCRFSPGWSASTGGCWGRPGVWGGAGGWCCGGCCSRWPSAAVSGSRIWRGCELRLSRLVSPGWWYTGAIAGFLYLPILVLVVFSFNDSLTLVFPLKGFTLRWYGEVFDSPELLKALRNSLWVGLASSLVATALGTAAGLAITRFRFRLRGPFLAVATIPLVIPSCVLGVALLLAFAELGLPP